MLGGLTLGKAHIGVRVLCGIQVFSTQRRVPIILIAARHPDLLPRIDPYDFFIILWEGNLWVGPRQPLSGEKPDTVTARGAPWTAAKKRSAGPFLPFKDAHKVPITSR